MVKEHLLFFFSMRKCLFWTCTGRLSRERWSHWQKPSGTTGSCSRACELSQALKILLQPVKAQRRQLSLVSKAARQNRKTSALPKSQLRGLWRAAQLVGNRREIGSLAWEAGAKVAKDNHWVSTGGSLGLWQEQTNKAQGGNAAMEPCKHSLAEHSSPLEHPALCELCCLCCDPTRNPPLRGNPAHGTEPPAQVWAAAEKKLLCINKRRESGREAPWVRCNSKAKPVRSPDGSSLTIGIRAGGQQMEQMRESSTRCKLWGLGSVGGK